MMDEPPDDRALAAYMAQARHHRASIELANNTLYSRAHTKRDALEARTLQLREQAVCGLRVMEALAGAWYRDKVERRKRRDQCESEVRQRPKKSMRGPSSK
jgi:hypothetical protein